MITSHWICRNEGHTQALSKAPAASVWSSSSDEVVPICSVIMRLFHPNYHLQITFCMCSINISSNNKQELIRSENNPQSAQKKIIHTQTVVERQRRKPFLLICNCFYVAKKYGELWDSNGQNKIVKRMKNGEITLLFLPLVGQKYWHFGMRVGPTERPWCWRLSSVGLQLANICFTN